MFINKKSEIKTKLENFKKEYDRYPLYVKDFTINNKLMTSYNGLSLNNITNIQQMYKELYKNSFYDYHYILNEVKLHLTGHSKKTTRFSVLQKDERYKKVMLFLFTYFKNYKGYYPEYKDFENTYYFPFIVGIEKIEDLNYNNLFSETNINNYLNSKEYEKISKVINEDKVKKSQKEYIYQKDKSNPDNKKAEEILVKIMNICIKNKVVNVKDEIKLINLLSNKMNSNELAFINKNMKVIIKDINSLLSLIKDKDINNVNVVNLNNSNNNNKGYDFLIETNKDNIFVNYKYVKGRTSSNLSLSKILGKSFTDIIKMSPETLEKSEKYIKKVDNFVFNNYLKEIFKHTIDYIFNKYKSYNDDKINIKENIYMFIEETIKEDVKLYNIIQKKIKNTKNLNIKDLTINILNVINKSTIKILTKNNINNKEEMYSKEDFIKENILKNIEEIKFLKSSILYENFNQENYKNEYKEIIRVFYRDNEIMKNTNEKIFPNNDNLYDKEIFKIFYDNFVKSLSIKERIINTNQQEKENFLKYILHLEFNDTNDGKNNKGVILQDGVLIDTLSFNSIKDKIKDMNIKIDNIKYDALGYIFDLEISHKNQSILKFNKNFIKSSEGKFLDYFRVEFSTNIEFNQDIIIKFNQSQKIENQSSNKRMLDE